MSLVEKSIADRSGDHGGHALDPLDQLSVQEKQFADVF